MSAKVLQEKSYKLSLNLKRLFNNSLPEPLSSIHRLKLLGGFAPLKDEADWTLCWPFRASVELAFPSFTKKTKEMTFMVSSFEDLDVGNEWGIKMPKTDATQVVPEALLIPGRAFAPDGARLGRGAGFYDRYLSDFSGLKIGICFNEQIMGKLPLEKHDIPVNCVVTDETTYIGGEIWN